jgi:acetoin utilization protein AcuC
MHPNASRREAEFRDTGCDDANSRDASPLPLRRAAFISSPDLWRTGFGGKHPLKPERLARTVALLTAYGALDAPNVKVITPRTASDEELERFHTYDYIAAVRHLSAGEDRVSGYRYGFGPGDNPVFKGMYESSSLKAGGGVQAAELLLAGEYSVAFNFSGGLHHARPARASGFCIFNDVAVAIAYLISQGRRVAYVDIDAHHGDGVQNAFYDTDQVLTISLHQDGRTLFPGTGFVEEWGVGPGEGYSVNVPLSPDTDDPTYLWAFRQIVPPLIKRFNPDVLVTQLGADTHFHDPLTQMALTTEGHAALYAAFADLVADNSQPAIPWLACGGGGYNLDVVPRSWTLAFGVMSEQAFPDALPKSYREQYGGVWLHDHVGPGLDRATRAEVRRRAEETVAAVKLKMAL